MKWSRLGSRPTKNNSGRQSRKFRRGESQGIGGVLFGRPRSCDFGYIETTPTDIEPMLPENNLKTTLNQRSVSLIETALQAPGNSIVPVDVSGGATVLDFAIDRPGTMADGITLAKICMADLADVAISQADSPDLPLPIVNVATEHPVLACMASQYAGWPLAEGKFFAMCSGPARSLRGKEDVLKELDVIHKSDVAVGVLETSTVPTAEAIAKFASDCAVSESNVTLCVAKTASLPGTIQVVARIVETAMHKLHELGFDLLSVKSGSGSAPLPPIADDDMTALGWTNDAILYGGSVNLSVDTDDEAITSILDQVPSSSSSDFGTPFLDIFNSYDKDFYKIDKLLFSPAKVVINNLRSGNTFVVGSIHHDVLQKSFGPEASSARNPE